MYRSRIYIFSNQGVFRNSFLDCFSLQSLRRDRTDNTVEVTQRHHIVRDSAAHGHRLFYGFMAVTVTQCNLIMSYASHKDYSVRGRRTVGNMIGTMSAEYFSGIFFTGTDRSGMIKQRTKLADRDR